MKQKKRLDKQMLVFILLLAAVVCVLSAFVVYYHHLERTACTDRLEGHTEELAQRVLAESARTQEYMETISSTVYDQCTRSATNGREYLASLGTMGMLSRLELLMPDDVLYTASGEITDPSISFARLAKAGHGITPRSTDPQSPGRYIVRFFTPVRRNGQTVAILCGVVKTYRLAYLFPTSIYDGEARFCLLEGQSGNYLIDAWHDTPGNFQDAEDFTFLRGYSAEACFEDIRSGHSGFTVLRVPDAGGNHYMYYSSVGLQDWTVTLTVPERTVFAQSYRVLTIFLLMVLLLTALAVPLFVWFRRNARLNQARTDLQLQGARYMLQVQELLFQAQTQSERFRDALDEVVSYLAADAGLFFTMEPDGRLILRSLSGTAEKAPPKRSDFCKLFPQLAKTVLTNGSFFSNRSFLWGEKDKQSAKSLGMRNIMLVRLGAQDGTRTLGVLGAINADPVWDDTSPLAQVAPSFTMAYENYKNYLTLSYLSQVDELTGVMNRNSYQTRLEELEGSVCGNLGCIYIDANGLHEINNHLGHDAGDEMLRSVANALLSSFEKKNVFRLGGDEFAVLIQGMSRQDLEQRAQRINAAVEKVGYSISIGMNWEESVSQVASFVATAEAAMRENKANFYANQGRERQMRNLNTRLEQTLTAKRDSDALLSYLVPSFLGVYFVDPVKDICRTIIAPPYFERALREVDGSFSKAFAIYTEEQIQPDDHPALLELCDLDRLQADLNAQGGKELYYRRLNGARIHLKIIKPRRAEDNPQEIIFLFSNAPD